jgi:RND superfamily putative drug exporter
MQPFRTIGFEDKHSESTKANQLLYEKLGYSDNNFIVLYTSPDSFASHPEYLTEIENSLSNIKDFPLKNTIIYPTTQNHQISSDDHSAYAVILVKTDKTLDPDLVQKFKDLIKKPSDLEMKLGGVPIFVQDTQTQAQHDLYRNEYIATPVAIITMLVIYGSVIAALLPIIMGGVAVFLTFIVLYFIGQQIELSVFTLNIALLLSAILSLDYSLLIFCWNGRFSCGASSSDCGIHLITSYSKCFTV